MEIGTKLNNRYTLTARLGQGAMGLVFRAADAQTGQDVALKVIARELAFDSEMLQRFRREGEALRQLRHPNIVGFNEMFAHDGQNIIVMEYVSGGSLHDLIKRGPLPADRARRIALEVGDALTRAHHIGIIHRDLKPENVLLTPDGTPKLTDFGVARLMTEGTHLTGAGTQVGTPYYMSPEAWEGKPLDGQTDIWSLGVVFYEMLTGKLPFGGDTVVAVMNQVLNAPLPDLRSLRPDTPPGLARIVTRMLCRNKAERYQTMREVAADIERGDIAAPTRPVPAAPPQPVPPAADQTRLSPSAAPTAMTQPRPNRLTGLAWALVRLGFTALIGFAVIGCVLFVGGALVLGNILEGVVTSIPFFPEEIGPGATYVFSRSEVESQLNRQTAQALPGTLSNLRLTFIPTATLQVDVKIFGTDAALLFRAEVADHLPRVFLESFNGLSLPLVGDTLAGGVNRGLAKTFSKNKLEMVSIVFTAEALTLVIDGPGVQSRSNCSDNRSFRDAFTTAHGLWTTIETAEAKAYIEKGVFVLRAMAPQTILTQYLDGCSFGDAQITVDAVNPNQGSYVEYGLIFNRKSASNYRAFLITSTGFYAFEKVTDGEHQLWPPGWMPTGLIHTDGQTNQLGLRVEGITATPSLNGQALPSYKTDEGIWGNVGLQVGSGGNMDVEVQFDNFAVDLLAEATPFPTLTGLPATPAPGAVTGQATPAKPAAQTTPTLTPIQQGLTLGKCNNEDLCIIDYLGHQKPLGLSNDYILSENIASWSPDGQQIAFAACLQSEKNRPNKCRDLYTIDRNSLKVVEVYRNTLTNLQGLSWSPDGAWIAFVEDGQLAIIRPTGKDRAVLDASIPGVRPAWAPDSQHLAWVAKSEDGKSTVVWVIDRSGKNRKLIFLDANQPIQRDQVLITWNPEGTAVAFMDEAAQAWLIKADCQPVSNQGCAESSRTKIKEVPQHWLSDFFPQWAGEKTASAPASAPTAARTAPPKATSAPKRPTTLVNLGWPTGCSPNPAPAGFIIFDYGVGVDATDAATALQAVGQDTYGTIVVNGQAVPPATSAQTGRKLDSHGRTVEASNCNTQCGFQTLAAIQLEPGQYEVSATWPRADGNPDPRSCTLTVTGP